MTPTGESEELALVRAQAEASAWIALLHSPDRNAAVEAGLKRWIAANPLHAAVWETATDLWNETAALPRRIPWRSFSRRSWRVRIVVPLVGIAALALLAAGAVIQYSMKSTVSTGIGEQRTLNLDDGTRVELNTDTHLRLRFDRQTRMVILESGEAYFQVAHEFRPFVVVAGERTIVALGTAFTVRREDAAGGAVTVTLLEGRVAVEPTSAETGSPSKVNTAVTVLNPGQRLRARRTAQPTVETASVDKATGWMRGQLIFDHTPLEEAAAEFSRYNKVKIVLASREAAQILIGGIFRIGDSRSFAKAVAASYGLTVNEHGDQLVLESANDKPVPMLDSPSLP